MIIGKFNEYIHDKGVTIQSKRLIEEMKVFVWKYGRAEAQPGYNDDLVMSFGTAMYIRDTSLKFRQQGLAQTKAALNGFKNNNTEFKGVYTHANPFSKEIDNPYHIEDGKGGKEDISWLL